MKNIHTHLVTRYDGNTTFEAVVEYEKEMKLYTQKPIRSLSAEEIDSLMRGSK